MKRLLILILLIIFSLPAMGQYDLFGQYNNPFSVWGSKTKTPAGGNYVQRAWDFFNAVTAKGKTLTDAQKRWYNDSIFVPGIAHGYIGTTRAGDSLVALYSFSLRWAGDSTVANMNLLDPTGSYNCIHYGGVTYTDSGVVGNGSSGYLNTFFNPNLDSGIFKAWSGGLLVVSKTNNTGGVDMGTQEGSSPRYYSVLQLISGASLYSGLNSTEPLPNSSNTDTKGVFSVIRSGYSNIVNYKNGTAQSTGGSSTYYAKTGINVVICGFNISGTISGFTTRCYPFAIITGGLSATKSQYLSDDLNNALKGAGYNVY